MSECSIDWVVESQLKCSQSYFMLFQLKLSKKNQLIYSESVNETDSVDQVDSFKEYHPLVWLLDYEIEWKWVWLECVHLGS